MSIPENSSRLAMTEKSPPIAVRLSAPTIRTYIHSLTGKYTVTIMQRISLFPALHCRNPAKAAFALPRPTWGSYGYS